MELYDYFFQILMAEEGRNISAMELMDIHWSLIKAVELGQYKELYNNGRFCGFLTWEIRPNEVRYGGIDLGITNLVILKSARGTYNLMKMTNYLRGRYPNVASFVWQSRKRNKLIEIKQRGNNYAKDIETSLQPSR